MLVMVAATTACTAVNFGSSDTEARLASINDSGILIDNGAAYTQAVDVTLTLSSRSGEEMYITNDPTCASGGVWEPISSIKAWQVAQSNSLATVYVKYRDEGIDSACLSDDIVHDDIAPTIAVFAPAVKFVSGSSETLSYEITELGSGLEKVDCTKNAASFACSQKWTWDLSSLLAQPNIALNKYTITVVAHDRAGNVSDPVSISFKVLPLTQLFTLSQVVTESSQAPDVLFVVDNSHGTMNYQANKDFHAGFGALAQTFAGLDWQAALITTNPTTATQANQMRDGRLVSIAGLTDTYLIDSSMDLASTYFANTMDYIFNNQDSHKPEAIESAILAMERSATEPNKSFFRANSFLSVVIYSDQDETLATGETSATKIAEYNKAVSDTFGASKNGAVYSIIRPEGDTICHKDGNKPGVTYDRLARASGGLVQSLCAPDFSEVMTKIGRDINEKIRRITLACTPYFDSEEQSAAIIITESGVPVDTIGYTLIGSQVQLTDPLPAGDYEIKYYCAQ
jgi:hypothetical protein